MVYFRDNFKANGPMVQVPVSWFNRVAAFLNNIIPGPGIKFEKHDDGSPTIVEAIANTDIGEEPIESGSLVCADASEIDQGEGTLWEAGGENGCKLQVFFNSDPDGEQGLSHTFYAARLVIGKMGNIVRIEKVRHGGAIITA